LFGIKILARILGTTRMRRPLTHASLRVFGANPTTANPTSVATTSTAPSLVSLTYCCSSSTPRIRFIVRACRTIRVTSSTERRKKSRHRRRRGTARESKASRRRRWVGSIEKLRFPDVTGRHHLRHPIQPTYQRMPLQRCKSLPGLMKTKKESGTFLLS